MVTKSTLFLPVDEKYSVIYNFFFPEQVHSHHRIGGKVNLGYMTMVNSEIQLSFRLAKFQLTYNVTRYRQLTVFPKQDYYIVFTLLQSFRVTTKRWDV